MTKISTEELERLVADPNFIRELVDFDPNTGDLTWKKRREDLFKTTASARSWNTRYAGRPAFTNEIDGKYLKSSIFNRYYLAHRVAWVVFYGSWPEGEIDHVNGNPSDNRISNLRIATSSENKANVACRRGHGSVYKGVSFDKKKGMWQARIGYKQERKHLGHFHNEIDARDAYNKASKDMHGPFSNTTPALTEYDEVAKYSTTSDHRTMG